MTATRKQQATGHPSNKEENKSIDFVSKIANLVIRDNFLLISLGVESMNNSVDHGKGLMAEREELGLRGLFYDCINVNMLSYVIPSTE